MELNAGLVPIRKPGKLPFTTIAHNYDLEYGSDTLQIHTDAIPSGGRLRLKSTFDLGRLPGEGARVIAREKATST